MMKVTDFVFLLIIPFQLFTQTPDFKKVKSDVLELQMLRERVQALAVKGYIPTTAPDSTFILSDSIIALAETENTSDPFFQSYSDFLQGVGHFKKQEYVDAMGLFQSSYSYFDSTDKQTALKCLNLVGLILSSSGRADSAIQVYRKMLDALDNEDIAGRINAHGNLGMSYMKVGNYAKAIDHLEKCLSFDSIDEFAVLNSYLNIASIYQRMDFYQRGIKTLKQVDIEQFKPHPVVVAYYNNLGMLYYQNGQPDSALLYLKKGLNLALELKAYHLVIKNRMTMSKIFLTRNQPDSSLQLLKAASIDIKHRPILVAQVDLNLNWAKYHLEKKAYDSVLVYANKILDLTKPKKYQLAKRNIYEVMAKAYEGKQDPNRSTEYYKMHVAFTDSLKISQKNKFSEDAKARFELAEQEKLIASKKKEVKSQKKWQMYLLLGLIGLSIVTILLVSRLKRNKASQGEKEQENEKLKQEIAKNKNKIIELKSKAILSLGDIMAITSDGHYLEFKLKQKVTPEVDRNQIKNILGKLPNNFVQIHRSHVVNLDYVKMKYADKVVLIDETELPVSRKYKRDLNEIFKKD